MQKDNIVLSLPLEITKEEHAGLHALATRERVSITKLIEAFIADVTGSLRSGGSDEREYAQNWVERRGFTWPSERGRFLSLAESVNPDRMDSAEVERRMEWYERWSMRAYHYREAQQRAWQLENARRGGKAL